MLQSAQGNADPLLERHLSGFLLLEISCLSLSQASVLCRVRLLLVSPLQH